MTVKLVLLIEFEQLYAIITQLFCQENEFKIDNRVQVTCTVMYIIHLLVCAWVHACVCHPVAMRQLVSPEGARERRRASV